MLYAFLIVSMQAAWSAHLIVPDLFLLIGLVFGEEYKLWSSSLYNFLHPVVTSSLRSQYSSHVAANSAPPFHHLRLSNVLERISLPSCEPLYATDTSHRKQETFLYDYPLHCVLLPTENVQQNSTLRYYTPHSRSPFWLLKPASEHEHARLLPRLSWSWTVLLPSDTYRKLITSITAVLLPFVTYLLIIPRARVFFRKVAYTGCEVPGS
jgi:hypothetical protein